MQWLLPLWLSLCLGPVPTDLPPTLAATLTQATQQDQRVLLYFSGSDWCLPCIRFKRGVLADSAFQAQTADQLLTYVVDFPRRDTASAERVAYKARLAEKYNPEGSFPHLVLLDAEGGILWQQAGYQGQSAADLLATWQPWLPQATQP